MRSTPSPPSGGPDPRRGRPLEEGAPPAGAPEGLGTIVG